MFMFFVIGNYNSLESNCVFPYLKKIQTQKWNVIFNHDRSQKTAHVKGFTLTGKECTFSLHFATFLPREDATLES